jgi:hypothetical protein
MSELQIRESTSINRELSDLEDDEEFDLEGKNDLDHYYKKQN